jgi:hypothetical protein
LPEAEIAVKLVVHIPLKCISQIRDTGVLKFEEVGSVAHEFATVSVAISLSVTLMLIQRDKKINNGGTGNE